MATSEHFTKADKYLREREARKEKEGSLKAQVLEQLGYALEAKLN